MPSNFKNPFDSGWGTAALAGAGASLLAPSFSRQNPADEARGYLDQIPSAVKPYLDPYINRGNQARGNDDYLNSRYRQMSTDPQGLYNSFGAGYKESPGYKFKLSQGLQAGNNAYAAGGMAGSPEHAQASMETAEGIAGQDYDNYMSHIQSLFGGGLQGEQNYSNREQQYGYNASQSLSEMLAQALQNQGQLAYSGAQSDNESSNDTFGSLAGLLGMAAFL